MVGLAETSLCASLSLDIANINANSIPARNHARDWELAGRECNRLGTVHQNYFFFQTFGH